ncbi:PREDICTED: uncharacterized protein LOC106748520 isoform X1 [Dinoponera quadriceps]|uniref:Uncharacterized protein LOC106748520 isoform X1 n=1 Tax=Dinoponera quadriceps TaxID=609295 RepID=A0A6P3XVQ8_DINQU|nr:PREDICTED: uncharacterized protein LOC106748520 isoform X1 [Dinoponera quadriceps]XP_014482611.1 PREDICTED: uncharacterized protein LOC106748520 isoform X1 [Dinoponera quadriceps]XP_014482612.1 PREDICTED: uncharacterized protein LOC106748520 isoform X1 [Dinoponera quadriceps]
MEGGISRLDCYEDMFKEITRKLYGEDPDHRTSSVQNEFETSVSYKNDEDTGNGTDGSDDGNWTCEDEPLKGTDGSRIAAYHASKATWRCYECGDVMGGGPREAAEHFMELHSSRILADESRHRHHSPRKDYLQADLKVDDVVTYLERLRERAERAAPPTRRTQETQTLPATLLPMTPTFLLQELPSAPQQPQHLHQTTPPPSTSAPSTSAAAKRYKCQCCPYGTDRRDLFVRHENIHREEKPFYCYMCHKPFNRADHVKKHFSRMHRDDTYDVSRIRKPPEQKPIVQDPAEVPGPSNNVNGPQQQHVSYQSFAGNRDYQIQPTPSTSNSAAMYQAPTVQNVTNAIPAPETSTNRRGQNSGCHSKSHTKSSSKNTSERRFACNYCSWTGADNWCLKRHHNTHIKPYQCTMCEYRAARSERLATHMTRVHSKYQCTKCGTVCENEGELVLHQHQSHKMNNASTASTSRASIPTTSRVTMQPTMHPSGGGRAPPGPPVFPAPAQPIIPQTTATIMPPTTTILGHEMVKSPATATTMAYPTEEEKRSYRRAVNDDDNVNGDDDVNHDDVDHADDDDNDDDDNDGVVRSNGNREERNRDFGACRVCSFKGDRDFKSCSDHSIRCIKEDVTDVSNRPLAPICGIASLQCPITIYYDKTQDPELFRTINLLLKKRIRKLKMRSTITVPSVSRSIIQPQTQDIQVRKRRRKQLYPQKLDAHMLESEEDVGEMWSNSINQVKIKINNDKAPLRLFRCILCPRHTAARGIIDEGHRPYHTRASLLLHKLWRHRRRVKSVQGHMSIDNVSSLTSSITLKAIFVARPNYNYYR